MTNLQTNIYCKKVNSLPGSKFQYLVTICIDSIQIILTSLGQSNITVTWCFVLNILKETVLCHENSSSSKQCFVVNILKVAVLCREHSLGSKHCLVMKISKAPNLT